jgi:hypothetical protein
MTYSARVSKIMSRNFIFFFILNTVSSISRIDKVTKIQHPILLAPECSIFCGLAPFLNSAMAGEEIACSCSVPFTSTPSPVQTWGLGGELEGRAVEIFVFS